jgi:hypothetical protein
VVSQLFWFAATLDVALAIGFALRVRAVATDRLATGHFTLARSQRKDNWLTCAVIWIMLLSEGCRFRDALSLAGAMALAWLAQRTLQRMRSLPAA